MARKVRVEYPGAVYQLMNRGDRREPLFAGDADRRRFLETPGEETFRLELLARLRAETTMPAGWIAERSGMGSRDCLNQLLNRRRKFPSK